MRARRFPSPLPVAAVRGILMLLLAVALTGARAAEDEAAGRVILAIGETLAVDAAGAERELGRDDTFGTGDTLRTGPRGRMQLRFTDGSRMSLRPESELVVEDYEFDREEPESSGNTQRMRLNRGGFRTVTGRIAANNREAYRVRSPMAVIGVRGTDYSAVIEQGNLLLGVVDGGIFASNNGGEIDLGPQQDFSFAVVTSFDSAPEGLEAPPEGLGEVLSQDLGSDDDGGDPSGPPASDDERPGESEEGSGEPDGDEGPQAADGGDPGEGPESGPDSGAGDGDDEGSVQIAGDSGPGGEGPMLVVEPGGDGGDEQPVFSIQQRCL